MFHCYIDERYFLCSCFTNNYICICETIKWSTNEYKQKQIQITVNGNKTLKRQPNFKNSMKHEISMKYLNQIGTN